MPDETSRTGLDTIFAMLSSRLSFLFSSWLLCLLLCLWLSPASGAPQDHALPTRPPKPESFNTPLEVNHYLEKLQEYYAIIDREHRYGKRILYLFPQLPVISQLYLPRPVIPQRHLPRPVNLQRHLPRPVNLQRYLPRPVNAQRYLPGPVIPQRYLPLPDRIPNDFYGIPTRYQRNSKS